MKLTNIPLLGLGTSSFSSSTLCYLPPPRLPSCVCHPTNLRKGSPNPSRLEQMMGISEQHDRMPGLTLAVHSKLVEWDICERGRERNEPAGKDGTTIV